jgi:hypothetical protein
MSNKFEKISKAREDREEQLYSIDENYSDYAANCPVHPGVRKYRLSEAEKKAKGLDLDQIVWRCPVDDEIFVAEGSVADQTDGFSSKNVLRKVTEPITDEGFEAAEKLSKAMGYNKDELK